MASIVPTFGEGTADTEARDGGLVRAIRTFFEPYAAEIKTAFVFGSVARGADTDHSDVDLIIIGDDLDYSGLYTAAQNAERTLNRPVNALFLSPEDWRRKVSDNDTVFGKILQAPKLFIMGSEKDLRSWAPKSSTIL